MDSASTAWATRRVFVTGCTGFLGTWVVRELLARGANVVGLIRHRVTDSELIRHKLHSRIHVVRGRLEEPLTIRRILAVSEADVVFHLATPPADSVLRALRAVSSRAVLVAPGLRANRRDRVISPELPTVFGPGDRDSERLVPRMARALVSGDWPIPPRRMELEAPHVFAADAARFLVDVAETTLAPTTGSQPVLKSVTGADVLVALKSSAAVESDPRTDLEVAAAETLTWTRTRFPTPTLQNAAA